MNRVNKKALSGLVILVVNLGLLLFLPAWSIHYWQAWFYLVLFFITTGAITLDLMRRDPALLERRITAGAAAEKEKSQKIIQLFASFAFFAIFIVSAVDHRLLWSQVPIYAVFAGDSLLVAGLLIVFLVFRENTYASAIIEVDNQQKVIATGPYALVRHPMYSGALLMLIGTPPALDSWLGWLAFIPMAAAIVWRSFEEERFLSKNLPGYSEYVAKVRSRLIPGIF